MSKSITVPHPSPATEDEMQGRFGVKDRSTFERQMTAWEAQSDGSLAKRWRRLVGILMALAPAPVKFASARTILFFVADGKYRKQVFALNGLEEGELTICAPNILNRAIAAGTIGKGRREEDRSIYPIEGSTETLIIDAVDGKSPQLEPFLRDLTGWNRKAIRITLPATATDVQVHAVEQLCAFAATEWAEKAK